MIGPSLRQRALVLLGILLVAGGLLALVGSSVVTADAVSRWHRAQQQPACTGAATGDCLRVERGELVAIAVQGHVPRYVFVGERAGAEFDVAGGTEEAKLALRRLARTHKPVRTLWVDADLVAVQTGEGRVFTAEGSSGRMVTIGLMVPGSLLVAGLGVVVVRRAARQSRNRDGGPVVVPT